MLKTLEKETGLTLTFKTEIFLDSVGLDTVLFELMDENERYLLAIAYNGDTETSFQKLNDAVWRGVLLHRKGILLVYNDENLRLLLNALPRDEKAEVTIYENDFQSDFSMTRFSEIYDPVKCIVLKILASGQTVYLPVYFEDETAHLGTWMSAMSRSGLIAAIDWLFQNYKGIKKIEYKNTPYSVLLDRGWRHNDYFLSLPDSIEELDSRLSAKTRNTIRRQIKLIEKELNGFDFIHKAFSEIPYEWIQSFYEFKKVTHGMERHDYAIENQGVTDAYAILTGDGVVRCVLFSCERGLSSYAEAFAFDSSMPKYSFGKIILNLYYKELIKKNKKGVGLGGGKHDFKAHYGTFCAFTWSGEVTKNEYRVWKTLQCFGNGNKPIKIKRWCGRAEYVKKRLTI